MQISVQIGLNWNLPTGTELGNMKEDCFDSSSLWGPCDQNSVSVSAVSAVYTQPVHTDFEINRLID